MEDDSATGTVAVRPSSNSGEDVDAACDQYLSRALVKCQGDRERALDEVSRADAVASDARLAGSVDAEAHAKCRETVRGLASGDGAAAEVSALMEEVEDLKINLTGAEGERDAARVALREARKGSDEIRERLRAADEEGEERSRRSRENNEAAVKKLKEEHVVALEEARSGEVKMRKEQKAAIEAVKAAEAATISGLKKQLKEDAAAHDKKVRDLEAEKKSGLNDAARTHSEESKLQTADHNNKMKELQKSFTDLKKSSEAASAKATKAAKAHADEIGVLAKTRRQEIEAASAIADAKGISHGSALSDLEKKYDTSQSALKKTEEALAKEEGLRELAEDQADMLLAETKTFRREQAELRSELATLNEDKEWLMAKVDILEVDLAKTQKNLKTNENTVEEQRLQITNQISQIEMLEDTISTHLATIADTELALSKTQESLTKSQSFVEEQHLKITSLTSQIEMLEGTIRTHLVTIADTELTLSETQNHLKKSEKTVFDQYGKAKKYIADTELAMSETKNHFTEMYGQIKTHEQAYETSQNHLKKSQKTVADQYSEIKKHERAYKASQQEAERVQKSLDTSVADHKTCRDSLGEAMATIEEKEYRVSGLIYDLEKATTSLDETESKRVGLEKISADLRTGLKECNLKMKALDEKMTQSEADLSTKLAEQTELAKACSASTTVLGETVRELQGEVTLRSKRIDDLHIEVTAGSYCNVTRLSGDVAETARGLREKSVASAKDKARGLAERVRTVHREIAMPLWEEHAVARYEAHILPFYDMTVRPHYEEKILPLYQQHVQPVVDQHVLPAVDKHVLPVYNGKLVPFYERHIATFPSLAKKHSAVASERIMEILSKTHFVIVSHVKALGEKAFRMMLKLNEMSIEKELPVGVPSFLIDLCDFVAVYAGTTVEIAYWALATIFFAFFYRTIIRLVFSIGLLPLRLALFALMVPFRVGWFFCPMRFFFKSSVKTENVSSTEKSSAGQPKLETTHPKKHKKQISAKIENGSKAPRLQ